MKVDLSGADKEKKILGTEEKNADKNSTLKGAKRTERTSPRDKKNEFGDTLASTLLRPNAINTAVALEDAATNESQVCSLELNSRHDLRIGGQEIEPP